MSLVYRVLYLLGALTGGYSLLVVIMNMLPSWSYPTQVATSVVWLVSVISVGNWLFPMDQLIIVFCLSFAVDNWLWFWTLLRGVYRVIVTFVAGISTSVQGEI